MPQAVSLRTRSDLYVRAPATGGHLSPAAAVCEHILLVERHIHIGMMQRYLKCRYGLKRMERFMSELFTFIVEPCAGSDAFLSAPAPNERD